jgi:branched-chain amino acid aminotransferase
MERIIFKNGEYLPESEATISIYDSALMFGSVIFTMLRTFNKQIFKIDEHLNRLYNNLKYLNLDISYAKVQLADIVQNVINQNKFEDDDEHRILIDVTPGLLSIYHEMGSLGPNIIIADFPLRMTTTGAGKYYSEGINAIIPNQKSISSEIIDNRVKNRNRLHFLRANMEVSFCKGDNNWALLTDNQGFITEGTGSNFFIIKGSTLISPEPRNILEGISRKYIMTKLAPSLGLEVKEMNLLPYDILTANEAFFCCTPFCMLPVVSLNGQQINNGLPGEKTMKLLHQWSTNVGVNIPEQINTWDKKYEKTMIKGSSPYSFSKK